MTLNGNKINLPKSVAIMFKDKLKLDALSKENPCSSYHAKARFDLVYFGFKQPSRKSIRYSRYSSRKMACNLAPTCNFLCILLMYSTGGHDRH